MERGGSASLSRYDPGAVDLSARMAALWCPHAARASCLCVVTWADNATVQDPEQASWYKRLLQNICILIYWPRCLSFLENKWIFIFMLRTWHWCEIISCFYSQTFENKCGKLSCPFPAPSSGSQELPRDVKVAVEPFSRGDTLHLNWLLSVIRL